MITPQVTPNPGSLVLASFNLHAGIDGWGRPFDTVAACRSLNADVLILQECWTPSEVSAVGMAEEIAGALGYQVLSRNLSEGRRAHPHPAADHRWMHSFDWRSNAHALFLDRYRQVPARVARSPRYQEAEPGEWGIALLSRLPITHHHFIDLGRLPRDRATRAAIVAEIEVTTSSITVVGTHMSHLSYVSPLHYRKLRRMLELDFASPSSTPMVLAGDMNLWGPPVGALFGRHWRRPVRGRTWPAWRPHSQVDHILIRGAVKTRDAGVVPIEGSDHLPVRVRLLVGDAWRTGS